MGLLRTIADWFKYERLHHYPALRGFDKAQALQRLKLYEQEEYKACQPWPRLVWIYILLFSIVMLVLWRDGRFWLSVLPSMMQIPAWVLQYFMYRRIRRRVTAKVEAELKGGRMWTCYECGYDLRESPQRCPECGAPVTIGPLQIP